MRGLSNQQVTGHGFIRSALLVAGAILVVGLLLAPFAARQADMNGLPGLASAAAICLLAAWFAEGVNCALSRTGSHLTAMLFSMALRFVPPMAVCFMLAANGGNGRQHLAFVCYLLVFYLVMLAVETWLAVKRVNVASTR